LEAEVADARLKLQTEAGGGLRFVDVPSQCHAMRPHLSNYPDSRAKMDRNEAMMIWMIYGAYGFTGELIAREARRRGAHPVLAGRDAKKIAELAAELSFQSKVFSLDRSSEIAAALNGIGLILNCAGPFSKTADALIRACLIAKVHYLDITVEIDVLEGAHRFDAEAKSTGVILCPGVGFDVAPTDCIALMLKTALPEANELALGFESDQRMSVGTAKTAVEVFSKSGKIRRGGRIVDLRFGQGCREIDFGRGPRRAMPIPWGDVASAFYSTGIPNITVFTPVSSPHLIMARLMNVFGFILRSPSVQTCLLKWIERTVRGPDAAARAASPTSLWGEAKDPSGRRQEIRVASLNGYSLTVLCSLSVVERLIANRFPPGCWTPAAIMGKEFILGLPGTSVVNQDGTAFDV
jgi:short subunit dehydrogenase-like uncharacterized protein